jgi:hypothetical protein
MELEWLDTLHSIWRYAVLLAGLGAVVVAALAMTGSRSWDALSDRLSFFFPLALDIQFLIGVGVWLLGDWPRSDTFLMWIHPLLMLVALGLAHVGRARSERESGPRDKGRVALVFFAASLLVILIAIPLYSWPL